MQPSVHVVIPCYNYGRYLSACVDSVLSQSGVDVHALIIDDCSTDGSQETCRAIAATDSRISVILHETNRGHIATYNEGLALAKAKYVVLLSADDLLTPGSLQRATALMEAKPSVGMVYGHSRSFLGDQLPTPYLRQTGVKVWRGYDWLELMCSTGRNFIHCPEVVMRTEVQHRIGGYSPELPQSADMEMWMRAAIVSDIGYIRGASQAFYRIHEKSMLRTIHAGVLHDLNSRISAFETVLGNSAHAIPDASRLLASARRAVARTALRHVSRSRKCAWPLGEAEADFYDFARTRHPPIVKSWEWRRFAAGRLLTAGNPVSVGLARMAADFRKRVQWHRWRWTGVDYSR